MVVTETVTNIGLSFIQFLPNLTTAVILLFIGWLVGWVFLRLSRKILDWIKIDNYIFESKSKRHFSVYKILPIIISWGIYLIFIQAAVESLGIKTLVDVLGAILGFLPGVIGSILVLVAGYAIGEYVRRLFNESKIIYNGIIGKGIFFFVIYIAIATALPLVNINTTLINNILLVLISSVGAGVAIAIGLGLKDEVALAAKLYRKSKK